ncbi:MAG: chaperone protein dnaJ 6 [Piptocephalis tieghemiana]|nr:MAG: chaperone protein dnaJ 6 [Piptocephalis tieghemiana]
MSVEESNLYSVLGLQETATASEIKWAYRRLALRFHPDKLPSTLGTKEKEEATASFQALGHAYAILGDEKKRERYDRTGSVEEEDFPEGADALAQYFSELYERVSMDRLEEYAKSYRGSDEERADVFKAYETTKGDMTKMFELIPVVNVLDDEERLRDLLLEAIEKKKLPDHAAFTKETQGKRKARWRRAKKEADEAKKERQVLSAKVKSSRAKSSEASDLEGLGALIRQRNVNRMESLVASLEEKYGPKTGKGKGGEGGRKRRKTSTLDTEPSEGPSEEEFQRIQASLSSRSKKRRTT